MDELDELDAFMSSLVNEDQQKTENELHEERIRVGQRLGEVYASQARAYYVTLIAQGMPLDVAAGLTLQFQQIVMSSDFWPDGQEG